MRPALTYEQRLEFRARVSQARLDKIAAENQRRHQQHMRYLHRVAGDQRFKHS